MRLTKKLALRICMELWKWLEKTGGEWKKDWDGWKKYGKMIENCPCCEYATQENGSRNCSECLLISIWKGRCESGGTPWTRWCDAETKEKRSKYARIIWKACEKELNKMKKKTGKRKS